MFGSRRNTRRGPPALQLRGQSRVSLTEARRRRKDGVIASPIEEGCGNPQSSEDICALGCLADYATCSDMLTLMRMASGAGGAGPGGPFFTAVFVRCSAECTPGALYCDDGQGPIEVGNLCDGHIDCADRSDEICGPQDSAGPVVR